MLVQRNGRDEHPDHDRDVDATGYDLPLSPAGTRTASPVVAVLGRPDRVTGLPGHLPACRPGGPCAPPAIWTTSAPASW
jgi:hypothetical protein